MKRKALIFLVLVAAAAQAQTLRIGSDERVLNPELPTPEWKNSNGGTATAELRIVTGDAAALRLNFGGLFLPEGAEMMLASRNADGRVLAIHGPYTGSGPLNVPEFDSQLLAGSETIISVRAKATEVWPFTLQGIEQFTAENLTGLDLPRAYTPVPARKHPIDFRSAYLGDTLVHFNVEDGLAIMEGDIVLGTADEVTGGPRNKNADRASFALANTFNNSWSNGVIPYVVAYGGSLLSSDSLDRKITAAVNYWNSRFPGVLVKRTNQSDYVIIRFLAGVCQSPVGRKGGIQFIDIDNSCSTGNIVHEIGHVLGLRHEHTRYDRNSFVKITAANILPGKENNFAQPAAGDSINIGAYDFGSIMHYPSNAFAVDPTKDTITPLMPLPAGVVMGQRNALSAGDETGVRNRYCDGGGWGSPSDISIDPDGETHTFAVTIPPYCSWQTTDTANWITINSAVSGTGSTIVKFTATANKTSSYRSAHIKVGGRDIYIFQPKFNNQ